MENIMNISLNNLNKAVEAQIITEQQAIDLWTFLKNQPEASPRFTFTNVLYYLGGLMAIGAMTLFMTLGWETFGGWGIFFISILYAGVALKLATRFQQKGYPVPAGICTTFVVAITPLAIYGFQQGMGWWPDSTAYRDYHRYIKWHWIFMEFGTLIVGALAIWRYRYPFLLMPVGATLWYMTMDITAMLLGGEFEFELFFIVSLWFGLIIVLVAFWVDFRSSQKLLDYAFWLYFFGVIAFWVGLSGQDSDNELSKFIYFCINLALIGIGVVLIRRIFVVFGAFGCMSYLGYLSFQLFEDSFLFPIVLTILGFGIIRLGILWQRHERKLTATLRSFLPADVRKFLEHKQDLNG